MRMAMRAQTNGGIFYLLPNIAVRLVHLIPLLFLWSVLSRSGVETGMTLKQMLSYTCLLYTSVERPLKKHCLFIRLRISPMAFIVSSDALEWSYWTSIMVAFVFWL